MEAFLWIIAIFTTVVLLALFVLLIRSRISAGNSNKGATPRKEVPHDTKPREFRWDPNTYRGTYRTEERVNPYIEAEKERYGRRGEDQVTYGFLRKLDKSDRVFTNLILRHPYKDTSEEIDQLIISRRGVFVIETKSWNGIIYGNDEDPYWTFISANTGIQEKRKSPYRQNQNHVRAFRECLHFDGDIYNIILFNVGDISECSSDSTFTMESFLATYWETYPDSLTDVEVDALANKIKEYVRNHPVSLAEHREHIRQIKERNNKA